MHHCQFFNIIPPIKVVCHSDDEIGSLPDITCSMNLARKDVRMPELWKHSEALAPRVASNVASCLRNCVCESRRAYAQYDPSSCLVIDFSGIPLKSVLNHLAKITKSDDTLAYPLIGSKKESVRFYVPQVVKDAHVHRFFRTPRLRNRLRGSSA